MGGGGLISSPTWGPSSLSYQLYFYYLDPHRDGDQRPFDLCGCRILPVDFWCRFYFPTHRKGGRVSQCAFDTIVLGILALGFISHHIGRCPWSSWVTEAPRQMLTQVLAWLWGSGISHHFWPHEFPWLFCFLRHTSTFFSFFKIMLQHFCFYFLFDDSLLRGFLWVARILSCQIWSRLEFILFNLLFMFTDILWHSSSELEAGESQ